MRKARKNYKKEFKEMIIELIDNGQKISTISKEYGLNQSMVNRWKREFHNKNKPSFTGKGMELLPFNLRTNCIKKGATIK